MSDATTSMPTAATTTLDRRVRPRPPIPRCSKCRATLARVVSRSRYLLVVRCPVCDHRWSLPKPDDQD